MAARAKRPTCPVAAYARGVTSGKIIAEGLVQLSCARHLADVKSAAQRGRDWDGAAALPAIEFFGHLRHSTGEWAGEPLVSS